METRIISTPSRAGQPRLTQLKQLLRETHLPRLAVVGVGHDLWGDDGVGPAVVHSLQCTLPLNERLFLIDAGPVPENYSGRLREFDPDIILLVDAADIGLQPGSYQLIELKDLDGFSGSSHTLPLSIICTYLQNELHCRILLIGIQPELLAFGAGLSDPVKATVMFLMGELKTLLEESMSLKL